MLLSDEPEKPFQVSQVEFTRLCVWDVAHFFCGNVEGGKRIGGFVP